MERGTVEGVDASIGPRVFSAAYLAGVTTTKKKMRAGIGYIFCRNYCSYIPLLFDRLEHAKLGDGKK